MTMAMPRPLDFLVQRCTPELIAPAKPTPREIKILSPLDDQKNYQCQIQVGHFYGSKVGMEGIDPAKVIKEAISEALVYYYPFAGRLREGGGNDSLILECTGEGIMFIEANAQWRLDSLGGVLHPPFEGVDGLLYDAPGCNDILHSPLLLIQVTRFMCGGFTFALTLNHTICDATGAVQFMTAVAEMARGVRVPSIEPVWKRELLTPRHPLQVSCAHHAYDELDATTDGMHLANLDHRSFFFSLQDIEILRRNMVCSRFDIVSACVWKCRTMAMKLNFDEEVRLGIFVNARAKFNQPMPVGYYGNVVGVGVALSTVGELSLNPLDRVVDLVKKAKAAVGEEFMRSTIDFLVKKSRPYFTDAKTYYVTCLTQMNFEGLDFGWGKPLYGGPLTTNVPGSSFLPSKNNKGEDGILVTMNLPISVMETFAVEIADLLRREKEKVLEQTNIKPKHQSKL